MTLRVLEVTPAFHPATAYGGPIESTFHLLVALADKGCSVRVLTSDANGEARLNMRPSWTTVHPGLVVRYLARWGRGTIAPRLMLELLREIPRADIVHLTSVYSFSTIPTLALCRVFRRPVLWSPRGSLQEWGGTRRRLLKSLWLKACSLVMPSRTGLHVTSSREASESKRRLPVVRPFMIPNGIARSAIERVPRSVDDLRLIFLGRIDPIKNIEGLLHACALLPSREWRLSVVGDGGTPYVEELKRLAQSLGLTDRVFFIGPVFGEEKVALLCSHDVLVLPSHSENFGMVVLEALSLGLPVVASTGTPWQDLEKVGCGRWVDGAPDSLAAAIETMRTARLREMGQLGREWVQTTFTWPSIADQMLDAFRTLLEGRRH